MLVKNLQFALKSIRQNGVFSLINIAGLAVGICSALFIFIHVNFELSYDRFHERYEDIYRVLGTDSAQGEGSSGLVGITLTALGPGMEEAIPEVEETVRLSANHSGYVTFNGENYYADSLVYTEDAFFDLFSFKLLQSESRPLLDKPHAAVLTQAFATKVFGTEPPLGKVLTYEGQDFAVVGVMQDIPGDSHMQFDMLASLHYLGPGEAGLDELQGDLNSWQNADVVTYARLIPEASEMEVERKLTALLEARNERQNFGSTLQPLAETHLGSGDILFDFQVNVGDMDEVLILASVAVFILLIAGFNFMNLASARASLRAKEVGVRKSMGATRTQLARQFLLETLLMVAIATALALALLELLQPVVSLSLRDGGLGYLLQHRQLLLASSLALVFVGLVAGAYPAFLLSSVSPAAVLTGRFASTSGGLLFRRVLVVVQFALSIAILVGTSVAYRQLDFMKNRDLGFEPAGIVNLDIDEPSLQANYEALKNRLLQLPQVRSVAGSSAMPGAVIPRSSITPVGVGSNARIAMGGMAITSEFMDTLSMKLIAGRSFVPLDARDNPNAAIINESAARALGFDDAIGKTVRWGRNDMPIVGVVQDFHFYNMHRPIEPLMMLPVLSSSDVISIAIDGNAPEAAIAGIARAWEEINPTYPFSPTFFSDEYNKMFSDDERFATMVSQFSFVAVIIACLGLYGLASFSADQRKKEIGVRKVMGSSVWRIVLLLTNDFSKLVLAANLIAWPMAYFAMDRWLETFAYRIDLTPLLFIGSGAIALCIAWVTVASTVAKAASQRPVLALRYE
jgi:putative ABC transport system permease protein